MERRTLRIARYILKDDNVTVDMKIHKLATFVTITYLVTSLVFTVPHWNDPIVYPRLVLTLVLSVIALLFLPWSIMIKFIFKSRKALLLLLPVVLFTFSLCLTFYFSNGKELALFGAHSRNLGFLHYFSMIILFFLGLYLHLSGSNFMRSLERFFYFSIIPLCLVGLAQYYGFRFYSYENPYSPVISTFANPNYFSQYLALSLLGSLRLMLGRRSRGLSILSSLLALTTFYLNGSLQGPLILVIVIFIVMLFSNLVQLRTKLVFSLAVGSLFSLSLLLINYYDVFLRLSQLTSLSFRLNYINASLEIFREDIFWGSGIDNFQGAYRIVRTPSMVTDSPVVADNAHSIFLQILSTQGLFTTLSIVLIFIFSFSLSANHIKNSSWRSDNFMIAIVVISFLFSSLISIENQPNTAIGWLSMGVLYGSVMGPKEGSSNLLARRMLLKPNRLNAIYRTLVCFFSLPLVVIIYFRCLDYAFLYEVTSDPRISSSNVLERLENQRSGSLGVLRLSDSRYFYELCITTANREIGGDPSLSNPAKLLNFALERYPLDLNLLELKAQFHEVKGEKFEEKYVRGIIKKIDPLNPKNIIRLELLHI